MQPSTSQILACIRSVLHRDLVPHLPSGRAIELVRLVDLALCELLARAVNRTHLLLESQLNQRALITLGMELLERKDAPLHERILRPVLPNQPTETASLEELQSRHTELSRVLADLSDRIVELAHVAEPGWAAHARAWIKAVVSEETSAMQRAAVATHETFTFMQTNETELSGFAAYLLAKCGITQGSGAYKIQRLAGGFSRETFLLSSISPDPGALSLVARKEKCGGLLEGVGLPLRNEFLVLLAAYDLGLPVPRPRWIETDESILGGPFIVMDKAPGKNISGGIQLPGAVDQGILRELAAVLAKLHTADWQIHGVELRGALRLCDCGALDVNRAFEATMARWLEFLHAARPDPSPSLAASLKWLHMNVPNRQTNLALVHGDVGFHNCLFDGTKITALLDWELADLGDPARDLAQVRRFVETHVSWSEFMNWYCEAGGSPVPDEVIHYYEIFAIAISLICQSVGWESKFCAQNPPQIEYLELGLTLPYFYERLANAGGAIWSAPLSSHNPTESAS